MESFTDAKYPCSVYSVIRVPGQEKTTHSCQCTVLQSSLHLLTLFTVSS